MTLANARRRAGLLQRQVAENLTAKADELAKAYTAAYDAALSSVQGQYEIWDEAAKTVPTSIDAINQALAGQTSYWESYNSNLALLSGYTGEIEGLGELLSSFADGSEESVNAVAGIAGAIQQGDIQKVESMVKSWKDLKEQQKTAADYLAELKTDMGSAMDELLEDLTADIEAMDLSNEAWDSAMATVQGYIDAANDPNTLAKVRQAWSSLATTAAHALNDPNLGSSGITAASFGNLTPTAIMRLERGYASGTNSAAPGLALVGENGPELVYFQGGEGVLNAKQTSAVLSAGPGSAASVPVQITIQVQGNASQDTVGAMEDYAERLAGLVTDRVMDRIDEQRVDAARRSFR